MNTGFYKHVNNRSVMIEVRKSFYVKEKKEYKVRVRWWKYHSKAKYCFPIDFNFETITIKSDQIPNWKKPEFVEGTL